MKSQELFENKFVVYIITLIRLITVIPYKCVMIIVRSIAELGNFSSSNHPNGKEHYSCEYGSVKYYIYCGIAGMISCGVTHTTVVPLFSA
ncbi:unnamed protein product [Adineta steineri]|uniref:Uncharacterized protein n=1 Tax=Adineta steineri TaxID=433720 RepID=A0A816FN90_9BILA|nr:unnamed protein product [Adineta steineri]CAF1663867.1 unnamed protein product [Adineta steineri]